MICCRCSKIYYKKSYYDKHLRKNDCIKNTLTVVKPKIAKESEEDFIDIDEEIEKVALKHLKPQTPKGSIDILNDGIDNIISKVFMNNDGDDIEEIKLLKKQLDQFKIEIDLLKERVSILEKNDVQNITQENTIQPNILDSIKIIRKEKVIVDDNFALNMLMNRSPSFDAELLNKIYLEGVKKEFQAIKKSKKSDCIYWNGSDWMEDANGNNIKSIFAHNLKKIYTKVNVMEEMSISNNDYLLNQAYINSLGNKKYQAHLYYIFMETYL